MAFQRAYFPMKVINVSQKYGVGSHKLSYALDLSGKSIDKEDIYAPFDCKVTKLYQPKDTNEHANTVWLTSTEKVLCPNGYYGYLTVSITHPEEIANMRLGYAYKQADYLFKEGRTGNATGDHIHLEVAKGTTANWQKKTNGSYSEYVIVNKVKPEEYLFVKEDSSIKNSGGLRFIKESDITYKVDNVPVAPLLIHKENNYRKDNIVGNLYNDDEVINFYEKGSMSYIYHYETLGFVSTKYLIKK